VFFDLRTPEEKIMMALQMLLVKVALSAIGFVLGVTEGTVLEWRRRAAQKAEESNAHRLRELPVTQVQLDEMWHCIRRQPAQQAGPDGLSISTSVLERLTLTLRHAWAPLVRKSANCCKDRIQRRRRVVLFQAFDNVARPHMRLRVPLPDQEPQAVGLIQPKWCHRTPGMAAGLTDHGWTFRELLTAKFEPMHNQSGSG
jgi:hypothetical protein